MSGVLRGVLDICSYHTQTGLLLFLSPSKENKQNLFTFTQQGRSMITVTLSNRLSTAITSVSPQADGVERYSSDCGSFPLRFSPEDTWERPRWETFQNSAQSKANNGKWQYWKRCGVVLKKVSLSFEFRWAECARSLLTDHENDCLLCLGRVNLLFQPVCYSSQSLECCSRVDYWPEFSLFLRLSVTSGLRKLLGIWSITYSMKSILGKLWLFPNSYTMLT